MLRWTVHAMADGLVRMRIAEGATRDTYDDLVLKHDSARWIRPEDSDYILEKILSQNQVSITWCWNMEMLVVRLEPKMTWILDRLWSLEHKI
jgi:hypothetical protein